MWHWKCAPQLGGDKQSVQTKVQAYSTILYAVLRQGGACVKMLGRKLATFDVGIMMPILCTHIAHLSLSHPQVSCCPQKMKQIASIASCSYLSNTTL